MSTIVNKQSIFYLVYEVNEMISYAPFFESLNKKGITTYKLIKDYGVSRSLIDRLKHNKPISTVTLNDLCSFLDCSVADVLVYIPD